MGTWDAGIFEDDVALDVRAAFEDALSQGLSVSTATEKIRHEFAEQLQDDDDGPVVYLALAALQAEQGEVQPKIRNKALDVIAAGKGLTRWEESDPVTLQKRKQVLEELRERLLAL